jgi:hypothetical protein
MLPTKFQFIWPSGFRDFLEIDQTETIAAYSYSVSEVKIFLEINQSAIRIAYGGHVC